MGRASKRQPPCWYCYIALNPPFGFRMGVCAVVGAVQLAPLSTRRKFFQDFLGFQCQTPNPCRFLKCLGPGVKACTIPWFGAPGAKSCTIRIVFMTRHQIPDDSWCECNSTRQYSTFPVVFCTRQQILYDSQGFWHGAPNTRRFRLFSPQRAKS